MSEQTLTDSEQLSQQKAAYIQAVAPFGGWDWLHDDAEADFEAGFAAGQGTEPKAVALSRFEDLVAGDPLPDLRVEDFTGGFRRARALRAA